MSDLAVVFLAAVVACVGLGVYGFALGRYEAGRKVPPIVWQTKARWPYRRHRFPLWVQIVQWVCAGLLVLCFVVVLAGSSYGDDQFQRYMRSTIVICGIALAMLAGQALLALLHNRRSASYPQSGWYYDPDDADLMRWWNGVEWCEYTFPTDRVAPDPYAPTTAG
jgi:peptidoglycan/LPS O-acetylase OafA/YrhL